jgi:hypothetical protein
LVAWQHDDVERQRVAVESLGEGEDGESSILFHDLGFVFNWWGKGREGSEPPRPCAFHHYLVIFVFQKNMLMNSQTVLKQPFSNIQLELLKLYADNIPDEDLLAIKKLIAKYFFEKAKDAADKAWDEKGLDEKTLLQKHHRTPYLKPQ